MTLEEYISKINQRFQLGNSTEHTFRGDLQQLLESIVPKIAATNEPKRIACGSPDFVLTKQEIPIGFIEAKDIGDKDLEGNKKNGNKEQFDRYKNSLDNIAFTDYLDFHFYQEKKFIKSIAIGKIENGKIEPVRENFNSFERHIKDFCIYEGQTITSPKKLAEMMAAKAQFLAEVIEKSLDADENLENKEGGDSSLQEQFNAFKQILIHDITHKNFADVYAQTIAYGMFAARLHDESPNTFTRKKAAELIPKSNPFLRKLFQYIAGFDLDERLVWIVDSLSDIFVYANVEAILKEYGRQTQTEDALIHFYETFLAEYDPKLRKARGVWYTPKPVVNFIVRAVDELLKTEFNLSKGLTDSSKAKIKVSEKGVLVEKEVHKVQILDPATGTGTFLAETVEFIYKQFENQKGSWSSYVENDLLPRLNGFELLMASYAMAHLKLDFLLKETDFKPISNNQQRFRIFLTNSLEEGSTELESSFANWLSTEANEANKIKKDTPVMVILGNPPYSGESQNKGKWIMGLMEDYKKEPEGKVKLKEKNSKWINDDYVKFLRYGQHFIEKNESGILAFINPHGFLDNPTFRGMRWNLLKTYDKIYTIDLHGNSKKKEVSPDGSIDQNVFDIQQGVSINIFVKTGQKKEKELGKVYHYDLYGKREHKFDFLMNKNIRTIPYKEIKNTPPMYYMIPRDLDNQAEYKKGISLTELFPINSLGIQTHRDDLVIDYDRTELNKRISDFFDLEKDDVNIRRKYELKDNRDWSLSKARRSSQFDNANNKIISLKPLDLRWVYYDSTVIDFPKTNVMQHMLKENIGLVTSRQCTSDWRYIFVSKYITQSNLTGTAGRFGAGSMFPLYLYPNIEESKKYISTEEKGSLEFILKSSLIMYDGAKETFKIISEKYKDFIATNDDARKMYDEQKKDLKEREKKINEIKKRLATSSIKPPTNSLFGGQEEEPRKPNLNKEIVAQIAQKLGLVFTDEKTEKKGTFAPIDILDYIYAVLHSPNYREKYKEFLKIDFPRVPYPADAKTFWKLVDLGSQIRQIHLLESEIVDKFITSYPIQGENEVERPKFVLDNTTQKQTEKVGKVYINETQFFDAVPLTSWEFFIGGYQPAQKWLKDRKGRKLTFEEINHYQKIIVALSETDKLMKEVDEIMF